MGCNFKIEGKLINLRTTRWSDLDDYERWKSSDLKAWQFDGPWYKGKDPPLSAVINWRKKWLGGDRKPAYPFLEIETKDNIHIGWVVVYYHEDDPHMPEIGIGIYEDSYWGKGMGTEALSLWIDYLFSERKFTRLGFVTWEGNKGMIHIGEKLGFIEEARTRKSCEVNGIFYDRIKMGILRSEWEERKKHGV
jgi:RimJ/RimL family protein N-acetyltransferase